MSKKHLSLGIGMTAIFLVLLTSMALPIWEGKDFFSFADTTFNSLSKDSSYFIPSVEEEAQKYVGEELSTTISMDDNQQAERTAVLYSQAGADTKVVDNKLTINGDLGQIILASLEDSDAVYQNNGEEVAEKYGYEAKQVMYYWHSSLNKISENYIRAESVETGLFIQHEVLTRGVEVAYNYYGVGIQNVGENALLLGSLLVFYIGYTLLWGYAIYFLFEGAGLKMEKAKDKKEV